MKLYDCFTFYNEFDLLEVRLNHLYDKVDRFIIMEGSLTHRSKPKPWNLEPWLQTRYEKFCDKIDYYKVKLVENADPWVLENLQRDAISVALGDKDDKDVAMISDCDEIPSYEFIEEAKKRAELSFLPLAAQQLACNWYVDTYDPNTLWVGTVAASVVAIKTLTPQHFRNNRARYSKCVSGGCHFTYLGNNDTVINKIENFSHSEFDLPEYKNSKLLFERRLRMEDPFGRPGYKGQQLCLPNINFPKYLYENRDKYPGFFRFQKETA